MAERRGVLGLPLSEEWLRRAREGGADEETLAAICQENGYPYTRPQRIEAEERLGPGPRVPPEKRN